MNKIAIFCAVMLFAIIIGCGGGYHDVSSQEEVIYEASRLSNFKKLISVESVSGRFSTVSRDKVQVSNSDDSQYYYVVHVVVYENKDGNIAIARFNDQRPPRPILWKPDKKADKK
jgi:hypothetical protein